MPVCELCKRAPASIRCVEDACVLCGSCDREVHSANPLPHTRMPLDEAAAPDGEASATSRPVAEPPAPVASDSEGPSAAAVVPEPPASVAGPSAPAAPKAEPKDELDSLLLDFDVGGWLDAGFDLSELLGPVSPARLDQPADGLVPTLSADHAGAGQASQQRLAPQAHAAVPQMPQHRSSDLAAPLGAVPQAPSFVDSGDFDFVVPSFDLGSTAAADETDHLTFDLLTPAVEMPHVGVKRSASVLMSETEDGLVNGPSKASRTSASSLASVTAGPASQPAGNPAFMPISSSPDGLLPPVVKPSPEQLAAAKAADAAANAAYQASAQQAILAGGANLTREQRVARYLEKRKNRKFEKTIRYASRKAYAEVRPRIKGRFATREEVAAWKLANGIKEGQDFVMPATISLD